jgi:hypothetical protein
MVASSIPPHFWAEAVSTATYLINIQPSSTLQGGIPFEHLFGKTPDYSSLHLFICVCYVLLAPRECTKLTAQSVECVFLGYNAEHKGYCCWDPVARRMRMPRDVVFDESRPFYPRPTIDTPPASLVDMKNVFLNGELREDVYMRPPPEYSVPEGMVSAFCLCGHSCLFFRQRS